jgi:cytochrome c556
MRVRTIALLLTGVVAAWSGSGDAQVKDEIRAFMHQKLEHSQKLLEAVAIEDFDVMSRESQKLSLLSQEASWKVLQTEDYVQHSKEFRRTADAVTEAARKKNLDGAALAYVDLTMKCVNCHKYVRGVRIAEK